MDIKNKQQNIPEDRNFENMKQCNSFEACSRNFCPIDFELHLRAGGEADKCRWMREPIKKKINGREFISGGKIIPKGIAILTPRENIKWLNKESQRQWYKIKKNKNE